MKIIECIPNFCEGQNQEIIAKIGKSISKIKGVELKCIDSGYAANRSVYTFLGEVEPMFEAAYFSIKTALELIDMKYHKGTHPRLGAVDVFPFVPIAGIDTLELVSKVNQFANFIATEFKLPIYLYEHSQKNEARKDLAKIRKGEYESLETKMKIPEWQPDFNTTFNSKSGALTMGVRDVLVAFNINIKTKDVTIAKQIAADIRYSGKIVDGQRIKGLCSGVKALGWHIQDYDQVQVSMNIVDTEKTPVHIAYETCQKLALKYGTEVTGSELIGCIPKHYLDQAELYFKANPIEIMNLTELKPFDNSKNVIDFHSFNS